MDRRSAVSEFRTILAQQGVRQALQHLNRVSSHRFTAIFRFEGATLRNLHLIDRDDPAVERCPDQPVLESYCVYVRDAAREFSVEHAMDDDRVTGHPKQPVVQSYCGYPLLNVDGSLFGTICHFDFEPVPFGEDEVYLLETAAPLLVEAITRTEWTGRMSRPVGDAVSREA